MVKKILTIQDLNNEIYIMTVMTAMMIIFVVYGTLMNLGSWSNLFAWAILAGWILLYRVFLQEQTSKLFLHVELPAVRFGVERNG